MANACMQGYFVDTGKKYESNVGCDSVKFDLMIIRVIKFYLK